MKRKLMSTVLTLTMNAKVKQIVYEPQFEELLSVALRGSDCVAIVFTIMKYVTVLLKIAAKAGKKILTKSRM